MIRKGLGCGLGTGYKNLMPRDSYIHALSARGVKTNIKASQGFEIRREPNDKFRYGTLNLDYELDSETQKVKKIIPVIILFGHRGTDEDKITIKHEITHIHQLENVLFKPLRQKVKKGISLKDAERFVAKTLPKLNHDRLEKNAERSEHKP